jgi:hypothetical protein
MARCPPSAKLAPKVREHYPAGHMHTHTSVLNPIMHTSVLNPIMHTSVLNPIMHTHGPHDWLP